MGEFYALALAVEHKAHTSRAPQTHEALGQGMHATLHRPHTIHLHLGNQHQGSGRLPRRGTAVGGVTGKQLAQAWVGEMLAQAVPQAAHGAN